MNLQDPLVTLDRMAHKVKLEILGKWVPKETTESKVQVEREVLLEDQEGWGSLVVL